MTMFNYLITLFSLWVCFLAYLEARKNQDRLVAWSMIASALLSLLSLLYYIGAQP
jgi:multisubunit Na+/H+ antiporter MnhF subunit